MPSQRGVWASICCSHTQLSSPVTAIRTVLHIQALPARLCQAKLGTRHLQSPCRHFKIPTTSSYSQGGFSRCRSLFPLGNHYKQNQSKRRNPLARPQTPTNLFCREESSMHGQREQTPLTEARPNPEAPIPEHRAFPKTKLSAAAFGRVGSRAPSPSPQRRRMRQCKRTLNTARRVSCFQG